MTTAEAAPIVAEREKEDNLDEGTVEKSALLRDEPSGRSLAAYPWYHFGGTISSEGFAVLRNAAEPDPQTAKLRRQRQCKDSRSLQIPLTIMSIIRARF
jgi:hypothetical protein